MKRNLAEEKSCAVNAGKEKKKPDVRVPGARGVSRVFAGLLILALLLCGCGAAAEKDSASAGTAAAAGGSDEAAEGASSGIVPAAKAEEGLLRIAVVEPNREMDVHKSSSEYMIALNIYERLFDIRLLEDGTTELVPELAESYTLSEDGKTYSFTLRDDCFFWDGTQVKASDVAFTFSRMLSLPDSVQTDFADLILGAEDVMEGKAESLKGIVVQDDRHLSITLTEPYAGYLYQLATPSCSIYSEKFVTEAGDAYGTDPEHTMGSGPYRVTENTDSIIRLETNPYYREEFSVKKAEIYVFAPALMDRAFRQGGLDLLDGYLIHSSTWKEVYAEGDWKDRIISVGCTEIRYMMLNMDTEPLNDVRVRKAVQMAINREKILDDLFDGDGSLVDGIYPRGLFGFTEENQGWLEYDPEGARKLLEEVGIDSLSQIEIAVNSTDSTRDLTMAQMIQEDLTAVGLEAPIISYDPDSRMYLRNNGRLMAYLGVWTADYNDPDNFVYTFFGSREKTRYRSGNLSDKKLMKRIADARTIREEDKRLAEYAELEKILVKDNAVWVPFFYTNHPFVLGDRVESFVPYWAGWSDLYLRNFILK